MSNRHDDAPPPARDVLQEHLVRLAQLAGDGAHEEAGNPDAILQERARRLAAQREPDVTVPPADLLEAICFVTGGERHAFETAWVARVCPLVAPTRLPGLPAHIVGVMPFEGEVISIVDLRPLLGMSAAGTDESRTVIVLRGHGNEFGVLADELSGIERFSRDALQAQPGEVLRADSLLVGVSANHTGLLDAARLLQDPRLIIDQG